MQLLKWGFNSMKRDNTSSSKSRTINVISSEPARFHTSFFDNAKKPQISRVVSVKSPSTGVSVDYSDLLDKPMTIDGASVGTLKEFISAPMTGDAIADSLGIDFNNKVDRDVFKIFPRQIVTKVPIEELTQGIDDVFEFLRDTFTKSIARPLGGLNLDTVEVNLQASADGKLGLLGSGASLGGKASLKLVFSRPKG
jgi:hypothetical protein